MELDDYSEVLSSLKIALLEIRATSRLEGAKILADIFHNVPSMIISGIQPETIKNDVMKRAENHNCIEAVSKFFQNSS